MGQIRVVFSLPGDVDKAQAPSERLAYVKWFSTFNSPESDHSMHKLKRSVDAAERVASVIPISSIRRSTHLFPKFGPTVPADWTSDNVLEKCSTFYLNPFTDRNMYFIL